MHSHPSGVPLKSLAGEAGISLRSAYFWLARYRSGGVAAMANRVFAAPSGGRSIRSICSRPQTYGTSAARFATSPGPSKRPS
ncbi:MAG: helix-turn-helix domain-containing protein [Prochlorococcaceae cyanobacterium]